MLPAHEKTGAGLDVYVRTGTTTRATLLWGREDANALLMEVLPRGGKTPFDADLHRGGGGVWHECTGGSLNSWVLCMSALGSH